MKDGSESVPSDPNAFPASMSPAEAAILIDMQRDLLALLQTAADDPDAFLMSSLAVLQKHLGAQGLVIVDRDSQWTERASISARFVGRYDASQLNRASETQQSVFLPDTPAETWAQILVPLSDESVLLLAGRKFDQSDLPLVEMAAEVFRNCLQTLERFVQLNLNSRQQHADVLHEHNVRIRRLRNETKLIGESDFLSTFREQIDALTQLEFPLCLAGEPGTGKRAIARALHWRKSDSPGLLLEFSAGNSAEWDQVRTIAARPERGTILLSNVEQLSAELQEDLLQLLRSAEIVGSTQRRTWLIVTTTVDLQREVDEKRFQESLYRRLTVCSLKVPALQSRSEDVLPLAQHFTQQAFQASGRSVPELSHAACEALLQHSWPGNIAELRTVMERLVWRVSSDTINANDLLTELKWIRLSAPSEEFTTLSDATIEFQRDYIRAAISKARGNMTEAARILGLHRTNFYRKMHQLDMVEAGSTPQAALDS